MLIKEFKNKYGYLKLKTVTKPLPVKAISHKIVSEDCFFNIEFSEKIALITENLNIQIGIANIETNQFYLCLHSTPATAQICKIVNICFDNAINPKDEIKKLWARV